jgi:transposase
MANKHYPQQFKADAVALYRSRPGATIALIADDLGVDRETLRSWVRADDQRRGAGSAAPRPGTAAGEVPGSVEDENARLRRRIRELEADRLPARRRFRWRQRFPDQPAVHPVLPRQRPDREFLEHGIGTDPAEQFVLG